MERVKELRQAQTKEAGFTLVELAIVLVIIGLIIGGVLVGQDLIKAAEIRSTTADIERYNAAANTFRNKYNGLPGDLRASRAEQFGMTDRDGSAGHGDGNGVMEGCDAAVVNLGCETALFWVDLTEAQLIADAFTEADDGPAISLTGVDEIADYLPSAPLRDSAFISVFPQGGRNYYAIASFSATAADGLQTFSTAGTQALSALEASQLDDKIDDGIPTTGTVRAISDWNGTGTGAEVDPGETIAAGEGVTGACVGEGAAVALDGDELYNVADSDFASELNCAISIRSSF